AGRATLRASAGCRPSGTRGRAMSGVVIQILILLALLVANGVFAMAELAIASARKARLQRRAEGGDVEADAAPGDPRAVRRPDGSWLVDGMLTEVSNEKREVSNVSCQRPLPLDELRAIFPLGPLPGEGEGFFQTVGAVLRSPL